MATPPAANLPWDTLRLRWAASPVPAVLSRWWDDLLDPADCGDDSREHR
jgi:hypothetical protein